MPDKIISDAILHSGSWRRLSADARAIFAPLLPSTDPWGRRTADVDGLLSLADGLGWSHARLLSALEEYVREGMIELYCHDGDWYLQLVNHDRHNRQRIRLRKGASRYPPPPASDERTTSVRRSLEGIQSLARERAPGSGQSFTSSVSYPSASASVQRPAALGFQEIGEDPDIRRELKGSVAWFVAQLPDATERTLSAVGSVKRKWNLPEAALHAALEEVQAGGEKVYNKSGLFVAKLKTYGEEGRYAR